MIGQVVRVHLERGLLRDWTDRSCVVSLLILINK